MSTAPLSQALHLNPLHFSSLQTKNTSHKSRLFIPHHYTSHHFTYLRYRKLKIFCHCSLFPSCSGFTLPSEITCSDINQHLPFNTVNLPFKRKPARRLIFSRQISEKKYDVICNPLGINIIEFFYTVSIHLVFVFEVPTATQI